MKRLFLTVFLAACSVLTYMFALAHRNRLMTHSVSIKEGATEKLTVFFISDIHRRRLAKRLIKQLANRSIHAVIVGGDMAESGVPVARVRRNMQMLATVGPLYYIFGNNDHEIGTENVVKIIEDVGGRVLVDQTAPIPLHPKWGMCGLEDPTNGTVNIEQAIISTEGYEYTILAVHNPALFRKIADRLQPEIMLAGHTHGGQIRLGKWGLQELGEFLYTETGAQLISNGYGTTMVPLRLGAKPECHVVEIHY
ncbi:metallophosphoesterase [Sporosarcina sp. PTS2304]|uniref:metallophosphoesterase n=1 Tax=Sporosarcina sp. PTS2304 TaxID=2283194 RepID=UPI000E0E01DA|nr:metallophosphoesterase family protein [Sporosarcina sp. PTS2304]AXH98846.1 metallophosphoesterase [Sporosarcina sp. PTS2304]